MRKKTINKIATERREFKSFARIKIRHESKKDAKNFSCLTFVLFAMIFFVSVTLSCKTNRIAKDTASTNLEKVREPKALAESRAENLKLYELMAKQVNQSCPISIDSITVLESVAFVMATQTLAYNYKITSVEKTTLSEEQLHLFEKEMHTHLLKSLKAQNNIEQFRKDSINLIYNYVDKNGEQLLRQEFSVGEY